jgi:hypothetical protein
VPSRSHPWLGQFNRWPLEPCDQAFGGERPPRSDAPSAGKRFRPGTTRVCGSRIPVQRTGKRSGDASAAHVRVPGEVSIGRGNESLSLRLYRRSARTLPWTSEQITRYRNLIFIDRIEIRVELAALPVTHLVSEAREAAECIGIVALHAAAARVCNRSDTENSTEVARFCFLARDSQALRATAIARLALSARTYHRVLKLARTCADLPSAADILSMSRKLRALDRPTG